MLKVLLVLLGLTFLASAVGPLAAVQVALVLAIVVIVYQRYFPHGAVAVAARKLANADIEAAKERGARLVFFATLALAMLVVAYWLAGGRTSRVTPPVPQVDERGRVHVVAEDGKHGTVPADKLQYFLKHGGRLETEQERRERLNAQ